MSAPAGGSLLDGKPAAALALTDRGLHYGDGLFETLRVTAGKAPLWDYHMQRLVSGARRLGLPPPPETLLAREFHQLAGEVPDGVCKLLYTRGSGGNGYRPAVSPQATRLLMLRPVPHADSGPLRLAFCDTTLGMNPALAGLKHLNRLEQVLAAREVAAGGYDEGLMCDSEGRVVEATMHNLWLWRDGELVTPPLEQCGVAGVMRQKLLQTLPALGWQVRVEEIRPQDCLEAEALMLCNAVRGIRIVGSLRERQWTTVSGAVNELRGLSHQWLGIGPDVANPGQSGNSR